MKEIEIDEITNLLLNLSVGVHPNDLSDEEAGLLKAEYGEDWMNELGYTEGLER
ncbi:hypothetical protein HQN89_30055 [Paenibacillus frigoriresistens]|uniref:hypothetical protein n=1 Tax=Paenibacillus alginolyticus TaxID=59839 RepID=UPI0015651D03|nr:hypothetical protein [Paenibacillus frigoriresistens]NRF95133.1 hypothetical protein [Paenibacillus frigoriresistens]